jgi:hypothetical protein
MTAHIEETNIPEEQQLKKLTLTELLIAFAEWKEYNGKWETHEQQVKNFLKEYEF